MYVSSVTSPSHFSCQLVTSSEELPLFSDKLQDYYSTADPEPVNSPAKCTACVAKISADDFWYRAQVTDVKSDSQVEVYFVDYGNSEVVNKSELKVLTEEFMEFPAQAFLCSLSRIEPVSGDTWDEASGSRLEELCCATGSDEDGKVFVAEVLTVEESTDGLMKVKVSIKDEDYTIEEQLVEGGYAQNIKEDLAKEFQQMINLKDFKLDEDKMYEAAMVSMAEEVISEVIDKAKATIAASNEENREEEVNEKSITPTFDTDEGSVVDVEYLHGESPADFHVKMAGKAAQELKELIAKLDVKCKAQSEEEVSAIQVEVGDVVLAVNAIDQCWYRAHVVSIRDSAFEVSG